MLVSGETGLGLWAWFLLGVWVGSIQVGGIPMPFS